MESFAPFSEASTSQNSGGARRVASPEPGATDGGFCKAGKLMKDKHPIEFMKDRRMDSPIVMGQLCKETSRPIFGPCRQLALANGIDQLMILRYLE